MKNVTTNISAAKLSASFKVHAENLLIEVQTMIDTKANIARSLDLMRKSKVSLGKSRATCAMLAFIYDGLTQLKDAKGKPLSANTCQNYLSEIKRSVTKGTDFNLNSSRKAKPAGQSQTPKAKDKAALTEGNALDIPDDGMAVKTGAYKSNDDGMASEEKPAVVKVGAYKSNDDAIAAIKQAIRMVKTQCTIAQWKSIATLYGATAKLAD